jgi:hypothetical protein
MKATKLLSGKSNFLEGKVKVIGKAKTLEMKPSHALEMYKTKHLALGKSKELASLKSK